MEIRDRTADRTITYEELGIPRPHNTQITLTGTARTLSSLTRWEWAYLALSIVSLITSLVLAIYKIRELKTNTFDFTFALVLIYTTLFCFYYVVHGILKERPYELVVFIITTIVVMAYTIINYFSQKQNDKIKLIRLILVCVLGPILVITGLWFSRQYYVSNNLIFRTVGANINLQFMCKIMFLCSSLLRFDLQLQGSMLIMVMETGTSLKTEEIVILVVGIIITVIFIAIGFLSMRFENNILANIFLAMSASEPAYIIYKFYVVGNSDKNDVLHISIYICGVCALLIWISLVICMWFVIRNFGKGLKEKVYGDISQTKVPKLEPVSSNPAEKENSEDMQKH